MHKYVKYGCGYGSKWVKWKEKTNENFAGINVVRQILI